MRENKRNHLVTIGIRGLQIKYYEKCLTQQNKKTPLLTCCCSLPLAALHPTKAVKSTFFFLLLFASYYTQLESKQHKSKKRVEIKQILTHYEHTLGSFCCC